LLLGHDQPRFVVWLKKQTAHDRKDVHKQNSPGSHADCHTDAG